MRTLVILLFSLILISAVSAQTNDRATEIFEEVDARRSKITYETTDMNMVIYNSNGNTRNRSISSYSFNEADQEKSLLVFEEPANVRGTGFLTLSNGNNEVQKLYLPALGRIQTITASQKADRFMGSDFTYEDLGDQNPDDYDFELIEEKNKTAVLRAVKKENSQYAYIKFYINTERYSLEKAEYFDEDDEMIKRLEAENFTNVDANIWRANKMTMYDLKAERKTELIWSNRIINESIPEWRFTERGLKRGN
ncbi:MAG: outer membrane lipoprotein-sorting protein [Balneola sp.]|nr:outer membrane lipoprotein-sorting protein [Balneola sp.]MBO6650025.1 outer membrane lipoprotein-sorting protein [Balneola sp.]MBO6711625.1 outer membrane lipoprotein-sorting protein [Balneola sp.]MBO6799821.1 outer membrane lipoprotein-sorting protein [Balneola sp.]MBO6870738.1 outer membrane lipoprotein-sorting protein [Balneola sp.]